jgi:hypothetical protein
MIVDDDIKEVIEHFTNEMIRALDMIELGIATNPLLEGEDITFVLDDEDWDDDWDDDEWEDDDYWEGDDY